MWGTLSHGRCSERRSASLASRVGDTSDVETVAPDDSLQTAAGLMRDNGVDVLPVYEGGRLVGMKITDRDITVRAVAEGKPRSGRMVHEAVLNREEEPVRSVSLADPLRSKPCSRPPD